MVTDNMPTAETLAVEEQHEEQMALRWRRAILKLSETLMSAADERSDLSPILMEAMHNALEKLLVYGEERDLMILEEWLSQEYNDLAERRAQRVDESHNGNTGVPIVERRKGERRSGDRRKAGRRSTDRGPDNQA